MKNKLKDNDFLKGLPKYRIVSQHIGDGITDFKNETVFEIDNRSVPNYNKVENLIWVPRPFRSDTDEESDVRPNIGRKCDNVHTGD